MLGGFRRDLPRNPQNPPQVGGYATRPNEAVHLCWLPTLTDLRAVASGLEAGTDGTQAEPLGSELASQHNGFLLPLVRHQAAVLRPVAEGGPTAAVAATSHLLSLPSHHPTSDERALVLPDSAEHLADQDPRAVLAVDVEAP